MSSSNKRDAKVSRFLNNKKNINVTPVDDKLDELEVVYHGPKESPYEDGVWKVRVVIPSKFPDKAPRVAFRDPPFHPNIDFITGVICLDVLSIGWREDYELVHIFEYFIPQLLCQPNSEDPFNSDAAKLLDRDKDEFEREVREHCAKSAKMEDVIGSSPEAKEEGSGVLEKAFGGLNFKPYI
ncbi:hypothetical protein K1719_031566 [Acacia pycnantha]|nr:hypothetical protein K1719_031566 [Acacia pycnantha]